VEYVVPQRATEHETRSKEVTGTKQPEALRIASSLELCWGDSRIDAAAAELRRLHAENETLRTGYAAARLEIESLMAQSAGAMHGEHAELRRLSDCCPELNLSNYGPDDVDELNGWAIEVSQCIDRALAAQPAGAQQPGAAYAAAAAILEVIAQEPPINGSHIAKARVLIVAGRLRASHGQAPASNIEGLTAAQEPLGAEFEKVLHENLFDLYEDSAPHWQAPAGARMGHTDGGRNMFYEGRFDGESKREQQARLRWANDMRAAFERHTGNGWFDKDWRTETGLWSSAWHACLAAQPTTTAQAAPAYKDSTPELHIGDSAFESWYSTYSPVHKSDKQRARDAYAAGMGDPLVTAAPAAVAGPSISQVTEQMRAAGDHAWMTSDGVDSARVFWAMLAAATTTQPAPQADSVTAPAGGVAEPMEPTQEMIAAVLRLVDLEQADPEDHRYDDGSKLATQICRAVLAAATTQPAQAEDSVLEDAALLDFLIEQRAYVVSDPDACPGYWLHFVHKETGKCWVQGDEHPTPRAAIDAARKQGANHD